MRQIALLAATVVVAVVASTALGFHDNAQGAPPTPVMNVHDTSFQPFQASFHASVTAQGQVCDQTTVPAGKGLVIDFVSANAVTSGNVAAAQVVTTGGGTAVRHNFPLTKFPNEGFWMGATETTVYADPGSVVSACMFSDIESDGLIRVAGHLIDLP